MNDPHHFDDARADAEFLMKPYESSDDEVIGSMEDVWRPPPTVSEFFGAAIDDKIAENEQKEEEREQKNWIFVDQARDAISARMNAVKDRDAELNALRELYGSSITVTPLKREKSVSLEQINHDHGSVDAGRLLGTDKSSLEVRVTISGTNFVILSFIIPSSYPRATVMGVQVHAIGCSSPLASKLPFLETLLHVCADREVKKQNLSSISIDEDPEVPKIMLSVCAEAADWLKKQDARVAKEEEEAKRAVAIEQEEMQDIEPYEPESDDDSVMSDELHPLLAEIGLGINDDYDRFISTVNRYKLPTLQQLAAGVVGATLDRYDADSFFEYVPMAYKVKIFMHLVKEAHQLDPSDFAVLLSASQRTIDMGMVQAADVPVTDEHLTVIAELCPNLVTLNLRLCTRVTDEGIKAIAARCHQITSLNMTGLTKISKVAIRALAMGCPRIVSLSLKGCTGIQEGTFLPRLLARCQQLTELNLADCTSLPADLIFTALSTVNPLRKPLQFLDASNTGTPQGALKLDRASGDTVRILVPSRLYYRKNKTQNLRHFEPLFNQHVHPHVTHIDLSGTRCDDDLANAILSTSPNLTEWNIRECTRFTGVSFLRVAGKWPRMRRVLMDKCKLTGADVVEAILSKCVNLVELDVSNSVVSGVEVVAMVLKRNHPLRILRAMTTARPEYTITLTDGKCKLTDFHVGHSFITSVGLEAVVKACPKLRNVSLQDCDGLGAQGFTALLTNCPDLVTLDANHTDITDDCFMEVTETLNLTSVNLNRCPLISDVTVHFLASRCPMLQHVSISGLHMPRSGHPTYDAVMRSGTSGIGVSCVLDLIKTLGPRLVSLDVSETVSLTGTALMDTLREIKPPKLTKVIVSSCMVHNVSDFVWRLRAAGLVKFEEFVKERCDVDHRNRLWF